MIRNKREKLALLCEHLAVEPCSQQKAGLLQTTVLRPKLLPCVCFQNPGHCSASLCDADKIDRWSNRRIGDPLPAWPTAPLSATLALPLAPGTKHPRELSPAA